MSKSTFLLTFYLQKVNYEFQIESNERNTEKKSFILFAAVNNKIETSQTLSLWR